MFTQLGRTVRNVAIFLGVVLGLSVFVEIVRAYQVFYGVHPVCGHVFGLTVFGLSIWFLVWFIGAILRHPIVLSPHERPQILSGTAHEVRGYAAYLERLMRRLAQNPLLPVSVRERLRDGELMLEEAAGGWINRVHLETTLVRCEVDIIQPAVALLDKEAREAVRDSVRDVMLGVTLSPWRSADLLVVLYRNVLMVRRIAGVYGGRPSLREQGVILRDVLGVVATVNILNYGGRLLQNLTAGVPFLGRFADDIAQGVGAGLMTSIAGHTAMERCSSFRGWSPARTRRSLPVRIGEFLTDVKGVVVGDLLAALRRPVEAQVPVMERRPDLIERVRDGVSRAMDETAEAMAFVGAPGSLGAYGATGAGESVTDAAGYLWRRFGDGVASMAEEVAGAVTGAWRWVRRAGGAKP
jgi:hypothetical protein